MSAMVVVSRSTVASAQALALPDPPTPREWYTPVVPARLLDTRPGTPTVDGLGAWAGVPLGGGSSLGVRVLGRGGVPLTDVTAVVLNVTVTNPTQPSYLTVWPASAPRPTASNLNFVAGQTVPNLVVAKVGANGIVEIYNFAGRVDVIVDVAGYVPSSDGFTPVNPARLLDTRPGFPTIDPLGRPGVPLGPTGRIDLPVLGRGGVPDSDVDSVVLNVTATNVTAPSFLTLYPTGASRPTASNLNMVAGQTVPNLAVAKLGVAGMVSIYNHGGNTDVIVDVAGYFVTDGTFVALAPQRIYETRPGEFVPPGAVNSGQTIGGDQTVAVQVTGRAGVPEFGVSAVVLNVTAIKPTGPSFLTVWPTGAVRPNASNLNVRGNEVVPNLVIAKVGAGGKVNVYNLAGRTDLVVDVAGYFLAETGRARDIDLSDRSSCALFEVGTLTCWGELPQDDVSVYGGDLGRRPDPYELNTIDDAVELATGSFHTCAIRPAGDVWCWASMTVFDLAATGRPYESTRAWPAVRVALAGQAVEIDASYSQTCALLADGSVWCWGWGFDDRTRSTPERVANLDLAATMSISDSHGCALRSTGGVRCWGKNFGGVLGDGTTIDSPNSAVDVVDVSDADGVSVNGPNTCATRPNGQAKCWGRDFGPTASDLVGAGSLALDDVVQVVGGDDFTCVLHSDAQVSCGRYASIPAESVLGLPPIVYLAAGRFHVCAVGDQSQVYCWGRNNDGKVGDGTYIDRGSPQLVLSPE